MTEAESVALPLGDAAIFDYHPRKAVIKALPIEYFDSIAKYFPFVNRKIIKIRRFL